MRIERIVAGVDFSEPAIAGVKWAAEHFAPDAELLLVHVIDIPAQPRFLRAELPSRRDEVEAAARDYATTQLRELSSLLPNTRARWEIRVGRPFTELIAAARDSGADLMLVGPYGDRPRPWRPLGTTAERVIRASAVPVLVATNVRPSPPKRLLVPVDEADVTPTVLRWARLAANSFGADVTVVHVLTRGAYSHSAVMAEVVTGDDAAAAERVDEKARSVGLRWLDELATAGLGGERVTAAVTFGRAGDGILALAESEDSDLIILGRTGAGAVRAAILGSTVNTVLHGATCPVLVVAESKDYTTDEE